MTGSEGQVPPYVPRCSSSSSPPNNPCFVRKHLRSSAQRSCAISLHGMLYNFDLLCSRGEQWYLQCYVVKLGNLRPSAASSQEHITNPNNVVDFCEFCSKNSSSIFTFRRPSVHKGDIPYSPPYDHTKQIFSESSPHILSTDVIQDDNDNHKDTNKDKDWKIPRIMG